MNLDLNWMREELARESVAGVVGRCETGGRYTLQIPLLSLRDPDFEEAYALLCCFWGQWLQTTHCVLRPEDTHVLACFTLEIVQADVFRELLASLKNFSRYLA